MHGHFFLCSRVRSPWMPGSGIPLDQNCNFCIKFLKDPHIKAIEREKRNKEWAEMAEKLAK